MKSYHKKDGIVFMVKNDFLNGFVVTSTETLWLHRQVADMDYVGSLVATEQEYMEQIGRFVEKVKQLIR